MLYDRCACRCHAMFCGVLIDGRCVALSLRRCLRGGVVFSSPLSPRDCERRIWGTGGPPLRRRRYLVSGFTSCSRRMLISGYDLRRISERVEATDSFPSIHRVGKRSPHQHRLSTNNHLDKRPTRWSAWLRFCPWSDIISVNHTHSGFSV